MRRAWTHNLPALTRFTYGAINPLTVDQYTYRELVAYARALERHNAALEEANRG